MATNIYQYNGTLLVSVPDGALNISAAPIAIPGKGYTNYGAPVMQDVLWTMQNFAGPSAPAPLLQGVMWYDTNSGKIKIYTGTAWSALFQDNQDNIPDTDGVYDLGSPSNRFNTVYALSIAGDATIMRTTQTNIPTVNNSFNLGSSSFRYNTIYATTFNGTATQAQYADVAERYEADCQLEAGDLVKLGGAKEITKTTHDADVDVFGVVSTSPAVMMNSDAGGHDTHPYVAMLGRVPLKVIGRVHKGQRLVSSAEHGVARGWNGDEPAYAVIGRALEAKDTTEVGLVETVIGRW